MRLPFVCAALGALPFLALVPRGALGQDSSADSAVSTLRGVYTANQAKKGAATYQKHCATCHAPAAHRGTEFTRAWVGLPLFELYDVIRTTMPNDNPGRLSRGQYADIVAYLLQVNGLPAGERPLPSADERLKRIRIEVR